MKNDKENSMSFKMYFEKPFKRAKILIHKLRIETEQSPSSRPFYEMQKVVDSRMFSKINLFLNLGMMLMLFSMNI